MNLKEAYSILEIPQSSTPEEAKKKYRELTKQFHPDINKDPEAETKFKKINEAYQCIQNGKGTDREQAYYNPSQHNPFSPFGNQRFYRAETIQINTVISFKESVLGIKKDIKYNRNTKCQNCNGEGEIQLNNGCTKCGGTGQIVSRQGTMVIMQTCNKCYGKSQSDNCKICIGKGVLDAEISINVTIPGGIQDGNILRLGGMGHFVGNFGPMEQHMDVHLHVKVNPEPGLKIEGIHVVSGLQISLAEALSGCRKNISTIMGSQEIDVKPMSRHKDEVVLPKLGVNQQGSQRVILDVLYPNNISALLHALNDIERII